MTEEDLKSVLANYQQKCFELFNQNIVLETQVNSLQKQLSILNAEIEKLKKPKGRSKAEDEF